MAGSIIELSKYRYEQALEDLKNAKEVFNSGSYSSKKRCGRADK